MKKVKIPKADLFVSIVGFGAMSLGTDEQKATTLLHKAFDLGINYFDTADIYDDGRNEEIIGSAFRKDRHKIILATKAGNIRRQDGSGLDWNASKKHILEAAENSLRRLQTDYIDLFQLHGGTVDDPIDETIEAFEKLVQQGKIRYYGISSIRPNTIHEYLSRSNIVSVMMQYSLLDRRPEEMMLEKLRAENIAVLSRGALAQGLLAGKKPKEYLSHAAEDISHLREVIDNLENRKAVETAIQYVLANDALSSAVIGIRTQEQLKDAVAAANASPLSPSEVELLSNAIKPNYYEQHR